MSFTTFFQFGDVVLVAFPFTDQSTTKQRPAVIVSSNAYNRARRDVILMPITSQLRAQGFGELAVGDWQSAQLLKPSAIKPVIATLEHSLILKTLGRLSARDVARLRELLPQLLELT
jgi:mRNA interferase MazF